MISTSIEPKINIVFDEMRKLMDKSFSFDQNSLPKLAEHFYIHGIVYDESGLPVSGAIVEVYLNGEFYQRITTLSNGTFKFKIPVSDDTLTIEFRSNYGNEILCYNFYDILVILYVYSYYYLQLLQHFAQSKQNTYCEPYVGDSLEELFLTDKDTYITDMTYLRQRFKNWPFNYLNYGSPLYKNLKNLKFWHWHSTFRIVLKAIKDVINADYVILIPYDHYKLLFNETIARKAGSSGIQISANRHRINWRTVFARLRTINITYDSDFYYGISLNNNPPNYQILTLNNIIGTENISGANLYRIMNNNYSIYPGWTYAVPNYYIWRLQKVNAVIPPWNPTDKIAYEINNIIPDQIDLRIARYFSPYTINISYLKNFILLGALRRKAGMISEIWSYHGQVDFLRNDSLDLIADGEIYFVKTDGWSSEEQIKQLSYAIEQGHITTRQFYTLLNFDSIYKIPSDFNYKYMDKYWGGLLKGFINWRRV